VVRLEALEVSSVVVALAVLAPVVVLAPVALAD
jgi:hypothetical protein